MTKRIFIGIPIPLDIARQIEAQLHKFDGRKVPLINWHLTLHFLGNVEEEKLVALLDALSTLLWGPAFEMVFDHIGAFPHLHRAYTLWVGAHEGTLQTNHLSDMIGETLMTLNYGIDPRPYVPHITVQRFSRPQNLGKKIEETSFQPISMFVDRVILYESKLNEGPPQYLPLFTYDLKT